MDVKEMVCEDVDGLKTGSVNICWDYHNYH
jgi:hypothetical protein